MICRSCSWKFPNAGLSAEWPAWNFRSVLSATPALVSAFFVPRRMPYWYGYEMKAEFEVLGGAADFAPGQKVRIIGKLGARDVALTAVVTRYEFGRALEWQFRRCLWRQGHAILGNRPGNQCVALNGSGHRAHARRYEMPGRLFAQFIDAIFTRHAVARRDRAWLARLTRLRGAPRLESPCHSAGVSRRY